MDNGMNNMNKYTVVTGIGKYPAFKWCKNLNKSNVLGWYLPAINELRELFNNCGKVSETLTLYAGDLLTGGYVNSFYWSSTEADWSSTGAEENAYAYLYVQDARFPDYKNNKYNVRAVREF
jgi:hypothetical protein